MSTTEPTPAQVEVYRVGLEQDCNYVTGGEYPVLAEVLSYFPTEAELFILTQGYAADVTGSKKIRHIITHSEQTFSPLSNTLYAAGADERLDVHGYTARNVINTIQFIQEFRGKREGMFCGDIAEASDLVSVAQTPPDQVKSFYDCMLQKIMEVMELTDAEIELLQIYVESTKYADSLDVYIIELKSQMQRAEECKHAAQLRIENRIEASHPAMGLEGEL